CSAPSQANMEWAKTCMAKARKIPPSRFLWGHWFIVIRQEQPRSRKVKLSSRVNRPVRLWLIRRCYLTYLNRDNVLSSAEEGREGRVTLTLRVPGTACRASSLKANRARKEISFS